MAESATRKDKIADRPATSPPKRQSQRCARAKEIQHRRRQSIRLRSTQPAK